MSKNLIYLDLIRNLSILKNLILLDRYNDITSTYSYLYTPLENSPPLQILFDKLKANLEAKNFGLALNDIANISSNLTDSFFNFKCNKGFGELIETNSKDVSFCHYCSKLVYKVNNKTEFFKRKRLGQPVLYKKDVTPTDDPKICIVYDFMDIPAIEEDSSSDCTLPF